METHNQKIAKLYKPRNITIVRAYSTGNFTIKGVGRKYKLSAERVRQILYKEISKEGVKQIKEMRRLRAAERIKENYINRL